VTSDESADAAVAAVGSAPDVIINNAGQMFVGVGEAFTAEELTRQLDVNVVGIHRVHRAFLPAMRKQGKGLVINISSIAGRMAAPFFAVYHASKWGVEGYSLGMRRELACTGVDVVVVEPGPFSTELFPQSPKPSDEDGRAQSYPPYAASCVGRSNSKQVPWSIWLLTLIRLPCRSRILRTIARPKPALLEPVWVAFSAR
jgi:short-subunit dehydrogenase